jgi:preprotein translocase subunit SecE
MGRLQRKKTVSKKKKKNRNSDSAEQSVAGSAVKKPVGVLRGDKEGKSKPTPAKKKPISIAKTPKSYTGPGFIGKGIQFLREVKIELKKVTWPTRKQTLGSTVVVIVLVMIIAFFLGLVDIGLSSLVRLVLQ